MDGKEKLEQFLNYLRIVDKQIDEELQPYYERVLEREKAGMNSYGVANPKERVLLGKSSSIYKLQAKINACSSFEELEAKLKGEIAETQDNAILYDLQRQLNLISEYLISVEKTVSANDEFGGFKKR